MIRSIRPVVAVFLAAVLFFGCGKAAEKAQEAQQAMQQASKAAEQLAKAAEGGGQSLTGDNKPVPPVNFKVLMDFLPKAVGNMPAEKPSGETATMGEWTYSQAKCDYRATDGNSNAEVTIFDYAYISLLYAPYQMLLSMKYSRESSDGYERSTTIGGFPGFEKWTEDGKESEITVLVGQRFIVTVKTHGLADGVAKNTAESIDLKKLSAQKTA